MTGPSNGADRRETAVPDSSAQRSRPTPLGSRYLLEYPIGQGASGRVWHGRRRRDGAPVAIKVLREEYAADPDVIARFLRERSALQALDHPNLVRIDDLVVEGDTLAVVMELVDGQDLRRVFQRGSLDIRQVHVLLAQVADALAHIHDEGVLHRDIKPENILIAQHDGELTARLTDFGLAWVADGQQLTRSAHLVGTPAYVAPELLAGRPYGSAVDVYALGVTAYELLAGRRPFTADHPMALMRAHLDEEPQRPPGMSTDQWDIVSACLSKSPEERPTAAQLATWWENLRDGIAISTASFHAMKTHRDVLLSIDFGASNTSAALRWADGRIEPLLFDGSPQLPSAVYAAGDGTILTGPEALDAGRLLPERFDPYPKLRIHDDTMWLGDRQFSVVDLVAAVLRRVANTAELVANRAPAQVTITHPADWRTPELTLLTQAVAAAGLPTPLMLPEPVAAAAYLLVSAPGTVDVGGLAMVCDFGAGTATASVVRRGADGGFDVVATRCLTEAGGVDIDAAILSFLGKIISTRNSGIWHRLSQPETTPDHCAAWQLWDTVRTVKETLGRDSTISLPLPLLDTTISLDREQLEDLARPIVNRAVTATQSALAAAGVPYTDLAATFLIGGCGQMPQVNTRLTETLQQSPTTIAPPEPVVAQGAILLTPLPPKPNRITVSASGARATVSTSGGRTTVSTSGARATVSSRSRPTDTSRISAEGRRPDRHGSGQASLLRRLPRWQISVACIVLLLAAATAIGSTLRRPSAAASGVTACGYKIGFLGYAPGFKIPTFSEIALKGAKAAVDRYNAIHSDCTVELVEYNTFKKNSTDGNNADTLAGQQAEAIARDDKVLGVVGPTWIGEVNPSMPVLDRAGVPAISPMLTASNLSQRGWRVFHRTLGNHHDESAAAVRHLTRTLKATKVFVLTDDTDDTDKSGRVEDGAEVRRLLGATLVGSASILASASYAAQIDKIKAAGADSVYYLGGQSVAGNFVKQLRAARLTTPVLGTSRNSGTGLIEAAGQDAAEGFRATLLNAPPDALPQNLENDLKITLTIAGAHSIEGFDAATVLLSGIAAGNRTRPALQTWVHSYDQDGLVHHIKFTDRGDLDPTMAKVWISRFANGGATLESATAV